MKTWQKALERLEGAYSDSTLRSYRAGFENFSSWCRRRRVPSLPAAPATVASYVNDEAQRLKPVTIKQRLSAISKVHHLQNYQDPTHHSEVMLAMRRARRAHPSRPRQALGVTAGLRDQLLAVCSDDLIGLRDQVLVSLGFDTLCRRGELVAITLDDLTLGQSGRYSVLVRRAKNDPEGAGRIAHLSRPTSALIDRWLVAIGPGAGPLLRPVYRQRALAVHPTPMIVTRVLKKLAHRAELPPGLIDKLSGHSLRVGAAQQLTLDGRGVLQIMRVGGWRSMNVVSRYVENVDLDVWS